MISKETRKKAREKAEALVGQMTLEEKAAQLMYGAPALKRLGFRHTTGGMKGCTG